MEQNLYSQIYDFDNLFLAWQKARKGKTKKLYVIKFEKNLERNLLDLQIELKSETYNPLPLETFILRDPKTRKIAKSDFRDRIIHHALVNILEPIFEKTFVHDSCANRIGKGTLYALKRFEKFRRKVTKNFTSPAFCLKADIKHYFQEVNQDILLQLIKKKISDDKTLELIQKINANFGMERERERVFKDVRAKRATEFVARVSQRHASRKCNLTILRKHLPQRIRPVCKTYSQNKVLHSIRR